MEVPTSERWIQRLVAASLVAMACGLVAFGLVLYA
jgi:hypothetical protein